MMELPNGSMIGICMKYGRERYGVNVNNDGIPDVLLPIDCNVQPFFFCRSSSRYHEAHRAQSIDDTTLRNNPQTLMNSTST